jgi:hypothetical protein
MPTSLTPKLSLLAAAVAALAIAPAPAAGGSPQLVGPVKVYILSGQSNMVGMGDINAGSSRWGDEFIAPVVSIYEGEFDPDADYDALTPIETLELESFGGVQPTPFPGGGTAVVRGSIKMETAGDYIFSPGHDQSTYNIMEIDGTEVHRREPGGDRIETPFTFAAGEEHPFKITYLTPHANGLGWHRRTDIPGLLSTLVRQDGMFPHLIDDQGNWTAREDVIYKGVISAVGEGPLAAGIQGNTIGPELGFGHVIGDFHEEPVLLIKASIGNRSIAWDILPPGSEQYTVDGITYAGYKDSPASWPEGTTPEPIDWYAGKQYDDYVAAIRDVLDNFTTLFPQFKDLGYEIAGFAWWQGHKDGGNEVHASRYGENLANLIKAWRKEFDAPDAPWVTATVGFGGWEMEGNYLKIAEEQLSVSGESGRFPEFKGNVLTVETRDFWRDVPVSPSAQGYHYNRNAETYMLVGEALGKGMLKLLEGGADQ